MRFPRQCLAAATLLIATSATTPVHAIDDDAAQACFTYEARTATEPALRRLARITGNLTIERLEAGDPARQVWAMARLQTLVARLSGSLNACNGMLCIIVLDRIQIDRSVMRRTVEALRDGNAEMEIEKVDDATAQAQLAEILDLLAIVEKHVPPLPLDG